MVDRERLARAAWVGNYGMPAWDKVNERTRGTYLLSVDSVLADLAEQGFAIVRAEDLRAVLDEFQPDAYRARAAGEWGFVEAVIHDSPAWAASVAAAYDRLYAALTGEGNP